LGGIACALGSAILLFLTGIELSSPLAGWTAGPSFAIEAFQPSHFSFPLPYTFASVYGCLVGCAFLWLAVRAVRSTHWTWMFGAGTAAAFAFLLKPEFGTACYGTLALLIALRGYSQRSWPSVAKDILTAIPGVVLCGSVIAWMISIRGVEFMTQENILSCRRVLHEDVRENVAGNARIFSDTLRVFMPPPGGRSRSWESRWFAIAFYGWKRTDRTSILIRGWWSSD